MGKLKRSKSQKRAKAVLCVFIFCIMMLFGCGSDVKIEPASEDISKRWAALSSFANNPTSSSRKK